MSVERKEAWGTLRYDTLKHRFSYVQTNEKNAIPYAEHPVVLNIDLTMKCNMDCVHCVAKDFDKPIEDLRISRKLLNWINRSKFMVVVITGGEPLLPEYENQLTTLLKEIRGKGLIVDTNGTIFPSHSLIKTFLDANVLVRISWDSTRPQDETYLRRVRLNTKPNDDINLEYYYRKIDTIRNLRMAGVNVAVQTVIQKEHLKNLNSILHMPRAMRELSVSQWYLQRFIPSHMAIGEKFEVSNDEYRKVTAKLRKACHEAKIECITKKDLRHNCVVLLVGNGELYTQGERPREKILLGTIDSEYSEIRYFDYMSSADHTERYYG